MVPADVHNLRLESPRLWLRPPRLEDFDPWAKFMEDELAARFVGGTTVMHMIPPEVFTSTWAPIFLAASIPGCSALPGEAVLVFKKRNNTVAPGDSPLHVCTLPGRLGQHLLDGSPARYR